MDMPGGMLEEKKDQSTEIRTNTQERVQMGLVDFSQMDKRLYENRDAQRSKKEIKRENQQILDKKDLMDENERVTLLRNSAQLLVRDKKWYRLFDSESQEMTYVKNSLNYLINLLDGDITRNKENGKIMVTEMEQSINNAYITVMDACNKYIKTHPAPKHDTGVRRLEKVKNILQLVTEEKSNFEMGVSNLRSGAIPTLEHPLDLVKNVQVEEAEVEKYVPEGNTTNNYLVLLKAKEQKMQASADAQIEVNRTAYQKQMDEQVKKIRSGDVYIKVNEKLLSANLPKYLTDRIAALKHSQDMKKYGEKRSEGDPNITNVKKQDADIEMWSQEIEQAKAEQAEAKKNAVTEEEKALLDEKKKAVRQIRVDNGRKINDTLYHQEELRLKGKLDETDYKFSIELLDKMKKKIESLKDETEKKAQMDRYIRFLGHDFVGVFNMWRNYNTTVEGMADNVNERQKILDEMRKKLSACDGVAKEMILKNLENRLNNGQKLEKKTALEFLKDLMSSQQEAYGLDPEKDKDILALLEDLQNTQDGQKDAYANERLDRLFNRSLGKEAELFGQTCARGGATDEKSVMKNNVTTSVVACSTGMTDVAAVCWQSKVKFHEYGKPAGETTTKECTMSEAVEGEEMLTIAQQADALRRQKKLSHSILHYSPNASRQIVRLTMLDLYCLQTDRHWRNYKCKVTKSEDSLNWTIESLKAYDHDMSFGAKSLDGYFTDLGGVSMDRLKDRKVGHLSPLSMKIKKDSKEFRYLKHKYIDHKGSLPLADIKKPEFVGEFGKEDQEWGLFIRMDEMTFFPQQWMKMVMEDMDSLEETKYTATGTKGLCNDLLQAIKEKNPGHEYEADELIRLLTKMTKALVKYRPEKWFGQDAYDAVDNLPVGYKTMQERVEKEGAGEVTSAKQMCVTDVLRDLIAIRQLYQNLSLADVETSLVEKYKNAEFFGFINVVPGMFDSMIQGFMHQIKLIYASDEAVKQLDEESMYDVSRILREELIEEGTYGKPGSPEFQEELAKRETEFGLRGDEITVPTMLHMDAEGYREFSSQLEHWEETDLELQNQGMSDERRLAMKQRLQEIVDQKAKAERFLKVCAKLQGWDKDDLRLKFLLEKEDYEKLGSITELVIDPSVSYFCSEDQNFLAGEEDFKKIMTQSDKLTVKKKANIEKSQERQHGMQQIDINNDEEEYVPLINGAISVSKNSKMMDVSEAESIRSQQKKAEEAKTA